jgi:hypothetical protein
MKLATLLALLALAACSEPRAGLAIDARPDGVSLSPSVSGNLGGLTVGVRG